ncbi:MAG TPA: PhzF family phenazine biosynthesis protein [Candidatus Acidoferrales bacterium]|nr:PhzF family phenazine biosynthesis protein [Candidatus Acidoferrales bacterium]
MKRRFYQLDVFTDRPYAGNPLAVVTDADGLTAARMQAIAREMNLSETVFVQKPSTNRALARLRIFTTTRELPLAGHPVIGTWFLLAELGVVPAREGVVHVQQETGAGVLPVEIFFESGKPRIVTMTQRPARFRPARLDRRGLAAALGLRGGDLDPRLPVEFVSTGIFNLMVPLANRVALGRIDMEVRSLRRILGDDGVMAYCFVPQGRQAHARGMLPWGLAEDPATGSAAGSLGAYLVQHGRLAAGKTLRIVQGVRMGRPSEIYVNVTEKRTRLVPRVSGAAVRILEGRIEA